MKNRILLSKESRQIRTCMVNGECYFVGKDVASVLGYKKAENAIAVHVDKVDKTSTLIQGSGSNYKIHAVFINESGPNFLVLAKFISAMTCVECGIPIQRVDNEAIFQGYRLAFPENKAE